MFTTRPDTIFGATFLTLSIEHEIVVEVSKNNNDLQRFINDCKI